MIDGQFAGFGNWHRGMCLARPPLKERLTPRVIAACLATLAGAGCAADIEDNGGPQGSAQWLLSDSSGECAGDKLDVDGAVLELPHAGMRFKIELCDDLAGNLSGNWRDIDLDQSADFEAARLEEARAFKEDFQAIDPSLRAAFQRDPLGTFEVDVWFNVDLRDRPSREEIVALPIALWQEQLERSVRMLQGAQQLARDIAALSRDIDIVSGIERDLSTSLRHSGEEFTVG